MSVVSDVNVVSNPKCLRCDAHVSIPVFRFDNGDRVMDFMCGSGHTWTVRERVEVQYASVSTASDEDPHDHDHDPHYGDGD